MPLFSHPSQTTHNHPKYTVFISHAGTDKHTIALPLRSMLRDRGVSAFVDETDLSPGDNAPKSMIQAMETAPVGVFILSPEFAARKWPVKELYCFQRRQKEADSKRLPKPILIPVFYRLRVEDCDGQFFWATGQDGKNPFQDERTRFLERRKNGEPEANYDKLHEAMGSIASVTGIRNDVGASNEDSDDMKRKRDELVKNVCEAIFEQLRKISAVGLAPDQTISDDGREDKYMAVFNVPKNRAHVKMDLSTKNAGGEQTYEGKIRELVMEKLCEYTNIVGVYGAGGVGKTTAVKHVGNNKEVQAQFSDGVLFVKLGQDATVQEARAAIVRIVEESGGKRLGEELRKKKGLKEVIRGAVEWFKDRSVLLIADDVWEHEEQEEKLGEEFVGELSQIVSRGNGSALLFTTRSKTIAQKAVRRSVHIKAREVYGEEAREILMRSADRGMEDWEDGEVRPVIEGILGICGGLPVALVVSGKGVGAIAMGTAGEKKLAWEEYGGSMEGCREAALEKGGHDDYPALFVNVQASLRALSRRLKGGDGSGGRNERGGAGSSDGSERLYEIWKKRYRGLCVLEKQGWAPVKMVQRLWEMEKVDEAKNGLSELEEVGLVEVDRRKMGGKVVIVVSMHDLLHDAAARMAREAGGVAEEHRQLLDSYNARPWGEGCRAWWSEEVADDHYLHGNVGRHLVCSGGRQELVELLLRPEWMRRQVKVSGVDKLMEDFERGLDVLREWKDGDEEIGDGEIGDGEIGDGEIEEEVSVGVGVENESEKREDVAEALGYVKDAVRLGSDGVGESGREAYFQMQGRLVETGRVNEVVREYLERLSGMVERPMVHSVRGFLGAPGGALKVILSLRSGAYCMARMREEGQVVCGCWDGWIVVLDVLREAVLMEWEAHGGVILGIALSEDRNVIVSGSIDETMKMWRLEDGVLLKTFEGHRDDVNCVAVTRDAKRVISGGLDGAKEWDVESGSVLKEVEGTVWSLAMSRNEDYAYLGGPNGIRKWSGDESTRDDFAERRSGVGGRSETSSVGWRVRKWFCCGICTMNNEYESSNDGCNDDSTDEYATASAVCSMTLANNDRVLVTGHADGTVRMFSTETMTQIRVFEGHSNWVWSVAVSEDGQRVLSGSRDATIRVRSVESGKDVCPPLRAHGDTVFGICFMHGGEGIVSCSFDETVRIWGADGCDVFNEAPCHDGPVFCVAIMPCGRRVLSGSGDKTVRLWDLETGDQIGSALHGHSGTVRGLAVFAEGNRAVSGSWDSSIRIWDLKEWKEVAVLEGHEDEINSIAITPDERRVVSGSDDETVRVWELGVGHGKHSILNGHTSAILRVFVSVDGNRVVSVSEPEVIVWNIETLAKIHRFENANARRLPRHMVMNRVGEDERSTHVYGWTEHNGRKVMIRGDSMDEGVVVGTVDGVVWDYDISRGGEYMCVATGAAQVGILRIEK